MDSLFQSLQQARTGRQTELCASAQVRIHTPTRAHAHTCTSICARILTHTHTHTHTPSHTHPHTHTLTHTHTHIHTHTHTHTHTHIHTHTPGMPRAFRSQPLEQERTVATAIAALQRALAAATTAASQTPGNTRELDTALAGLTGPQLMRVVGV